MNSERSERIGVPILPLHDVVVYPHMVIPLLIGREKSTRCLEAAMDHDEKIMLVVQKEALTDEPGVSDLFTIGTVAPILRMLKLPDGTVKVLVKGLQYARISALSGNGEYFSAKAKYLDSFAADECEQGVLVRTAISQFEGYIKLNKKIPPEVLTSLNGIDNPICLADTIAAYMPLRLVNKQSVLEMSDVSERLEYLMMMMGSEIDLPQVKKHVRNRVKRRMEKSQHGYYLNEQMKAIQEELGEMDDAPNENEALKRKIDATKMPKEAKEKTEAELQRLRMMPPMSTEATVAHGHIDWVVQVPRNTRSKVKKDLHQAQEILDTDHYGLECIKGRTLEYLAVQSRVNKTEGPILCPVGSSGVSKTFLGQSIVRATGRKYICMTLGGVRDKAEIRGHHRVCIGSMPGELIQKMTRMDVKDPLFLLDEIDKMSSDMCGDLVFVLPEVLDPERNMAFSDHYLEVNYDLSDIMFVVTSDSMNVPAPLPDRMEMIRLSSYIEDERLNIARRYLSSKQIGRNALERGELMVDNNAIVGIIRYYTRETGVRSLECGISKLCRKAVKQLLLGKSLEHIEIDGGNLHDYLGVQRFDYDRMDNENRVGQVTDLAWTEAGDDLLTIEAACALGKDKLTYTGSLGEVMQEPIRAMLTVARVHVEKLDINSDFREKRDIHVHIPEGATSRDGPSAGIAICTALVSCLAGNSVRADVVMTGEIILRGQALPIGGLKERLSTAHRGSIKTVLIPDENKHDLEEIPDNIVVELNIHPVKRIRKVLTLALQNEPSGMQVMIAK